MKRREIFIMKKVIMSVIGLAIALALVLAIWVPIAKEGRDTASTTLSRSDTIDSNISNLEKEIR